MRHDEPRKDAGEVGQKEESVGLKRMLEDRLALQSMLGQLSLMAKTNDPGKVAKRAMTSSLELVNAWTARDVARRAPRRASRLPLGKVPAAPTAADAGPGSVVAAAAEGCSAPADARPPGPASPGGIVAPATSALTEPTAELPHPHPLRWLWDGWIPAGGVTVVVSQKFEDAATVCMDLVTLIARGGLLPKTDPGQPVAVAPRRTVLILTKTQAAFDAHVMPRLASAACPMHRVHGLTGQTFGPEEDPARALEELRSIVASMQVDMVVVPESVYIDMVVARGEEGAVKLLWDLCEGETAPAVLLYGQVFRGVDHFGKAAMGRLLEKWVGSYYCATDRTNGLGRLLIPMATLANEMPPTLAVTIPTPRLQYRVVRKDVTLNDVSPDGSCDGAA